MKPAEKCNATWDTGARLYRCICHAHHMGRHEDMDGTCWFDREVSTGTPHIAIRETARRVAERPESQRGAIDRPANVLINEDGSPRTSAAPEPDNTVVAPLAVPVLPIDQESDAMADRMLRNARKRLTNAPQPPSGTTPSPSPEYRNGVACAYPKCTCSPMIECREERAYDEPRSGSSAVEPDNQGGLDAPSPEMGFVEDAGSNPAQSISPTPSPEAMKAAREIMDIQQKEYWCREDIARVLDAFAAKAVAAEREACAKIAGQEDDGPGYGDHIAKLIRARGTTGGGK